MFWIGVPERSHLHRALHQHACTAQHHHCSINVLYRALQLHSVLAHDFHTQALHIQLL